jgi:hypothetical protein
MATCLKCFNFKTYLHLKISYSFKTNEYYLRYVYCKKCAPKKMFTIRK